MTTTKTHSFVIQIHATKDLIVHQRAVELLIEQKKINKVLILNLATTLITMNSDSSSEHRIRTYMLKILGSDSHLST